MLIFHLLIVLIFMEQMEPTSPQEGSQAYYMPLSEQIVRGYFIIIIAAIVSTPSQR